MYDSSRHEVFRFYREDSVLIWNGNAKKGLQTLRDFFQQLPPSTHNIQSIDCQPIAGAPPPPPPPLRHLSVATLTPSLYRCRRNRVATGLQHLRGRCRHGDVRQGGPATLSRDLHPRSGARQGHLLHRQRLLPPHHRPRQLIPPSRAQHSNRPKPSDAPQQRPWQQWLAPMGRRDA